VHRHRAAGRRRETHLFGTTTTNVAEYAALLVCWSGRLEETGLRPARPALLVKQLNGGHRVKASHLQPPLRAPLRRGFTRFAISQWAARPTPRPIARQPRHGRAGVDAAR
jgi:hypothetical protein